MAGANSFETEGTLFEIFPTEQKTSSFQAREFVLEITDGNYPQLAKFQMTQDKCAIMDTYTKGDQVKVSFNLSGRAWSKDGRSGYITNLTAWRVERLSGATQAAPPPAHAGSAPPVESYAPPVTPVQPTNQEADDLPF